MNAQSSKNFKGDECNYVLKQNIIPIVWKVIIILEIYLFKTNPCNLISEIQAVDFELRKMYCLKFKTS